MMSLTKESTLVIVMKTIKAMHICKLEKVFSLTTEQEYGPDNWRYYKYVPFKAGLLLEVYDDIEDETNIIWHPIAEDDGAILYYRGISTTPGTITRNTSSIEIITLNSRYIFSIVPDMDAKEVVEKHPIRRMFW